MEIFLLFALLFFAGTWIVEGWRGKAWRKRCEILEKNLENSQKRNREQEDYKVRHNALFYRTNSGILFLSPQGILWNCNSRAAEMLELPRENLLSSKIWNILENVPFREAFQETLESGVGKYQGEFATLQGKEKRYVRCRFLWADPENVEKGLFCIIQDFTREYRMRRNLEESEEFLNMIINFLPV
ncbi:MAG TPA: PAS domain-containing protein, partial [Synergistaceae bacterium]|nr:PAS domain-containing protein [Synergistaceae bacterium]